MPYATLAIHQTVVLSGQETHRDPGQPFTVDQAHTVMRYHLACRARKCPRKAAALRALVTAGRLVVSTRHPR